MKFRRRNNADGQLHDDEDSGLSGSAGHDMPPSQKTKSHPAAHGLPAPVAAMAAFTMLMIVLTCGVIVFKHRQFLTARGHLEQHYAVGVSFGHG